MMGGGRGGPVRCPECDSAVLHTPRTVVRRTKSVRVGLPLKVCHRCNVIIVRESVALDGWKVWTPAGYADLRP